MFDYHVHSDLSFDCDEPMAATCLAAIERGVTEIAFTDHVDFEPVDPSTGYYRAERYFTKLEAAREQFAGQLTVLSGAEVDFNTDRYADVEAFLARYDYDFVIGSVHCFLGNGRAQLVYPEIFEGRTIEDVYSRYFEQVHAAAATGWFDSIGHMDFPKRYAPPTHRDYDPAIFRDSFEAIFVELIRTGTAFEINTSGLRKPAYQTMPGPEVVKWYVGAGGRRITVGSDSHEAATVGEGIITAYAMLQICGIEHVRSFRKRMGTEVPLRDLMHIERASDRVPA